MGELREVFEKGPLHNEVDALKFKVIPVKVLVRSFPSMFLRF